ncbi:MAG: hypothetical protein NTZ16_06575 [Verrucomicrobia bacterium]|nr:hypothetical protein [Verrucomicrobiota bacterium]
MKHLIVISLLLALSLTARATVYSYDYPVNAVIPDGSPVGFTEAVTVSGIPYVGATNNYHITSVDVRLNLSGGFNGDLYGLLVLRSADGSTMKSILLNRVGRTRTRAGSALRCPASPTSP